ncbi:MAG: Carboxypeptidase G2 [Desulfovibrio sp.]
MEELRSKAFSFIDARQDEIIEFWKNLVNMESFTQDKAGNDKIADHLKKSIDGFGGTARVVTFEKAGNGLVASFGEPTGKAPICFMGHYDTVFPLGTVEKRPFKIEDGKAYGPGVLDMKGGVTMQIFVARALMEAGYKDRQIKIVLAGDEEEGHPVSTMGNVFIEECKGALAAFNFETGDISNTLVVARKGVFAYDMEITGVSVHAGREPQNGRSAILEAAHKIIDIQALSDYTGGITYNVGIIKGGVARNAVPDTCTLYIDVRTLKYDQTAIVEAELKKIAEKTYIEGTSTKLTRSPSNIGPMERIPGNDKLFGFVKKRAEGLGQTITDPILSGGGSDSCFSVAAGVPTIDQMGVKGQWNHSDREYAVVDTMFERAKLTIDCVLNIDEFEKQ